MKIYEIAILYAPKSSDTAALKQEPAKLLVAPKAIVAKSQEAAQIVAARMIPEEYVDRLDEVQVAVRPF